MKKDLTSLSSEDLILQPKKESKGVITIILLPNSLYIKVDKKAIILLSLDWLFYLLHNCLLFINMFIRFLKSIRHIL
ncbi:hypothetical protein SGLAD_v1c00450 [Spiroplasma gladiatoris]|uniref:Uncharacterized protein n=1 Tax=Spiroplasma gladiatoris TaxID=2143 RepID=A0A4P7AHT2_9MOLU|nr:hypothetical protein SGLAD_v1c00450 [Spiroplasma gladiatoris]